MNANDLKAARRLIAEFEGRAEGRHSSNVDLRSDDNAYRVRRENKNITLGTGFGTITSRTLLQTINEERQIEIANRASSGLRDQIHQATERPISETETIQCTEQENPFAPGHT